MHLRDYQQEIVDKVNLERSIGHKKIIIQSPTGSGKSIIFLHYVKEAIDQNKKVLIIIHKIELLNQSVRHVEKLGISVGVVGDRSAYKRDYTKPVQVATVQSLARLNLEEIGKLGLIIVDEAHHCHAPTYSRVIAHFNSQPTTILGFTATPIRNDGRGLSILAKGVEGFTSLVCGKQTQDLIDMGYLCPFKIYRSTKILDAKRLNIKKKMGEYDQRAVIEAANELLLAGDIVDTWKRLARNKKTILYPASVELSKKYTEQFLAQNIPAAHIDANTPKKQRSLIIEKFHKGEILLLSQHSIVIEGVDVPDVEAVQLARPTSSLSVFWQIIGRALRPAEGKKFAMVIDHTDTSFRLPHPTDEVEWGLDAVSLPPHYKHTELCPQCSHIYRPLINELKDRLTICPSCCHAFTPSNPPPKDESEERGTKEPTYLDDNPQESKREVNQEVWGEIERLLRIQARKGYKPGWVVHRVMEEIPGVGYAELLELADRFGYKPGWAFRTMQRLGLNLVG